LGKRDLEAYGTVRYGNQESKGNGEGLQHERRRGPLPLGHSDGIAHGYVEHNPAKQFKPSVILQAVPKTNYARIDAKELSTLLKRIEIYQGTPVTRLAMKLLAMIFVRTTELIEAKWSEFDLEAGRWDIPAERMKMRTPHIVLLAKQALEADAPNN
jgi:integrase